MGKTISLKINTWKRLHHLKTDTDIRGLSDVIEMLMEKYEEEMRNERNKNNN